jgi:DnaJ-domain-containing protein 1
MSRPLMQLGVGQLEEMFAKAKADPKVLKQLEQELQYRQVPRAVTLLVDVQAAMHGDPLATPPTAAPSQQPVSPIASPPVQPSLWEQRPALATPAATSVVGQHQSIAPAVDLSVARPRSPPSPSMPLEDAYKVLKTNAGASWESIEQKRRLLVQQSHPSILRPLSDVKRTRVLANAGRVNAAYAALLAVRCRRA